MQVSICGPNISFKHGATFEVHAAGCADLKRGACRQDAHPTTIEAASATEVCDAMYPPSDFDCESGAFLYDFHFAPCCAGELA